MKLPSGFRIVQSALVVPVPALQIKADFQWCSDRVRNETNAWLLKIFGTKEVAYVAADCVYVSPMAFRELARRQRE